MQLMKNLHQFKRWLINGDYNMAIEYKYLTQDEQDDIVAQALLAREKEHFHYQLNIDNYTTILASKEIAELPKEWPENLLQYKNVYGEKLVEQVEDDSDLETVHQLQFRDLIQKRLKTEAIEQAKCEAAYKALDVKLPDTPQRDAAIGRVQALIADTVKVVK